MNQVFLMSESPDIQFKTNVVAGEESTTVRVCLKEGCKGWSKNLDVMDCPFCNGKMEIAEKKIPIVRAVNSCRNCFYLVKTENVCMLKEKKLCYHASDYSEDCGSFKIERKAGKNERIEKQKFEENWKKEHTRS
ncbi:hypothetical protein J2Z37_001603 [Ammoniphilus resinae]|uniref:Uncharacterized protein n=2 Tax=Ammoniphilus resinae TaxID=861532 RepID=A0ABS4GNA9_9BACL|nr:hypothetical protein [Ammoniphilus resinae]